MRRWRGAFLCFDVDCDPGLEVHGEVVGEDGDFQEQYYESEIETIPKLNFISKELINKG